MTAKAYPITGEMKAAGYVFREGFTTPALFDRNGGVRTGNPLINDGLVVDGVAQSAVFRYPRFLEPRADGLWAMIEFEPDFASDEAALRYFVSTPAGDSLFFIRRQATGELAVTIGNTSVLAIAHGTWGPHWQQGTRNTLIVFLISGNSTIWLNGNLLGASATAFATGGVPLEAYIGTDTAAADHLSGKTLAVYFGRGEILQDDVDHLHAGTLFTSIAPSQYLMAMPCDETHASGADTATDVVGTAGITEAILGAGAAKPSGPVDRMFVFDGGDTIEIPTKAALVFSEGGADLPFTVALLFSRSVSVGTKTLIAKADGVATGEWYVLIDTANERIFGRIVDNLLGGYIGRRSTTLPGEGRVSVLVFSYDGSGANSGVRLTVDGERVDALDNTSGSFTRVRETTDSFWLGTLAGITLWVGGIGVPIIYRGLATCQMQNRALCYRLHQYRQIEPRI